MRGFVITSCISARARRANLTRQVGERECKWEEVKERRGARENGEREKDREAMLLEEMRQRES